MDFAFINDKLLISVEAVIFLICYISLTANRDFIRTSKLKSIIFVLFYLILLIWISSGVLPRGIHSVAVILSTIFLLSFITKSNVYNAAVVVVSTFLLIGVIETVVSMVYLAIFRVDFNTLMNDPVYFPVFAWTSKLVEVTAAILLFKFGSERLNVRIFKSNSSQYMFAALQLLLMTLFIAGMNFSINEVENKTAYSIMIVALYIITLVLSLFDIRERDQMMIIVNKKKTLDEYVKNLEDVISVIRREKHDFMNHMQTIYAICKLRKENALESIDNYIKRLTSDLRMSYRFYETGNDYVDGLLAIKSNKCFENDVELSVDVGVSFSAAAADESDIAGILGNILNNAIECLLPLPETFDKRILVKTSLEEGKFLLKIANNGPEIPGNMIHILFEKGVTSKANSDEHGLGLFIVRQMTLKNKGTISVSSKQEMTEFTISFNVRRDWNAESGERVIIQDQGA